MISGNTVIWKPSPTAIISTIAVQKIITRVLERNDLPGKYNFSLLAKFSNLYLNLGV
jgi:gamma-glutamyl phosphate reductase